MELEERRTWLEKKLKCKIPDPLWDELVRSKHAKAGDMDEGDEELLVERAEFGLLMRQRKVPDFGMSPRRFSPLYDVPSWMDSYHDVRREVFAKWVAYVAEDHPDVYPSGMRCWEIRIRCPTTRPYVT